MYPRFRGQFCGSEQGQGRVGIRTIIPDSHQHAEAKGVCIPHPSYSRQPTKNEDSSNHEGETATMATPACLSPTKDKRICSSGPHTLKEGAWHLCQKERGNRPWALEPYAQRRPS